MLHARDVLGDVLEPLWDAFNEVAAGGDAALLTDAAAAYAGAYEARQAEITEGGGDDDVRIVEGTVTISVMRMPADVVLRSSLAAVEGMTRRQARPAAPEPVLPALYDPMAGRSFTTLLIKPLGGGPPRRR